MAFQVEYDGSIRFIIRNYQELLLIEIKNNINRFLFVWNYRELTNSFLTIVDRTVGGFEPGTHWIRVMWSNNTVIPNCLPLYIVIRFAFQSWRLNKLLFWLPSPLWRGSSLRFDSSCWVSSVCTSNWYQDTVYYCLSSWIEESWFDTLSIGITLCITKGPLNR